MSIIAESQQTGFLNVTLAQAQALAGSRVILQPESSIWGQLMRVLASDLSNIPVGSYIQGAQTHAVNDVETAMITPNWEVIVGAIGDIPVGESFVPGWNYLGSIDVVLIILACVLFVPLTIVITFFCATQP